MAAGAAHAAKPIPAGTLGVEVFGQPGSRDETADRPLGSTLALFRAGGKAVPLPRVRPGAVGISLASVAARMKGSPGTLVLSEARRVPTPVGPVYLVPTRRGWLCIQGPTFGTCHRGLLRAGVTWEFWSTGTGIDVIGIAADDVTRVALAGGGSVRPARLRDNVFFVSRPLVLASAQHLPPLGTLVVTTRGGKRSVRVPLR